MPQNPNESIERQQDRPEPRQDIEREGDQPRGHQDAQNRGDDQADDVDPDSATSGIDRDDSVTE